MCVPRSSHPEVFCKKGVPKNFAKFAGKHLCQSLFLIKLQALDLRPATLLKKRLWRRCFPVNFAKFLRTPFQQNTSGRLFLLNFITFLKYASVTYARNTVTFAVKYLIFLTILVKCFSCKRFLSWNISRHFKS